MAEYCYECFVEILGAKYPKWRVIISKDLDLCEGCGEMKHVVERMRGITLGNSPIAYLVRKFRHWRYK